jgi:hypothetical protein
MMDERILERRRLLQLFALGSLTLPAAVLAGCAEGTGRSYRSPQLYGGGNGGEKSGGGGGPGGGGANGHK